MKKKRSFLENTEQVSERSKDNLSLFLVFDSCDAGFCGKH